MAGWIRFWFQPADPMALHIVRFASGLLFLAWLLPLAWNVDNLFGLDGWFDRQAYREASRLPLGPPQPFTWSVLYLCGANTTLLMAVYWASIVVLGLFTLGAWTRITGILSWVIVGSFTASPAISWDADSLLLILSFYLMIGYLLLGLNDRGQSWVGRILGAPGTFIIRRSTPEELPQQPSQAANFAVRLLQVHFAIVIFVSGMHKLQFGEWWSGSAVWNAVHPALGMTPENVGSPEQIRSSLTFLSFAAYAMLAWQIAFPAFAWRSSCRFLLLGGAMIGWIGCAFVYHVPTFGPALFIGCLSYFTASEWRRLAALFRRTPAKSLSLIAVAGASCVLLPGCPPAEDPSSDKPSQETAVQTAPPEQLPSANTSPTDYVSDSALKKRIEAAIDQVRHRELLLSNGFWTVFHGILGVGPSLTLKHPLLGIPVNAIDYICDGGELRGLRFIPTEYGVDVETGEMFVSQGHQDQFIAEMAQCGLPADKVFTIRGKKYKFLDFIRHSQMRARTNANQELSWTILAVGQYLGTDITWTNSSGEKLTFEDLVRYEVDANVEQAACGGTHRLFGLQWTHNLHLGKGGKTVGVWKDLADEQAKYQRIAREYQNADGSFSTDFFRGKGNLDDMQLRMNTTGHILEWLAYSLPEQQLRQEWMERAVNRLALMFFDIQNSAMESGTLYHAAHGLRIYYERVYGDGLGAQTPYLVLPPRPTK
jgi:hypothetical protein